jgi:peptide-methionine (S)-S-oxide reductase
MHWRLSPTLALLPILVACHGAATLPEPGAEPAMPGSATAAPSPERRHVGVDPGRAGAGTALVPRTGHELAAFAEGCFWGSEDTFRQVPGVVATAVGYAGGHTDAPTYELVCSHTTGHAEVVLVEFDPKTVRYERLLEVFFATHDPTTKNRQGPDVGDQYRSAIFTFSGAQEAAARSAAKREAETLGKAVTTEISALSRFWIAEDYHQQYDEKSGTRSCPLPARLRQGT